MKTSSLLVWKPSMINLSVPKKATAVDWLIVGKAEEGKGYLLAGFTKLFSRDNKDRQWFLSSHSRIIIHPSDPKTLSRILISRKPLRLNNITMCRAVGRSENPEGLEVRSNPRLFKRDYFSANPGKLSDGRRGEQRVVSSTYILDSSNSSSITFWTSKFGSSSRSNWTGISTDNIKIYLKSVLQKR